MGAAWCLHGGRVPTVVWCTLVLQLCVVLVLALLAQALALAVCYGETHSLFRLQQVRGTCVWEGVGCGGEGVAAREGGT